MFPTTFLLVYIKVAWLADKKWMNLLKTKQEKKRIDQGACLMIEIQAIIPSVLELSVIIYFHRFIRWSSGIFVLVS